jgi:hypothetical protein
MSKVKILANDSMTDGRCHIAYSGAASLRSANKTAFIVTFHYLGRDWFLCAKSWTIEPAHASRYINAEAAAAALMIARRYMRNKQVKARIVSATPLVESAEIMARIVRSARGAS